VDLRVPQRGDKKALMETVAKNAREALARHKTHRAGDLSTRGRALNEIQEALDLPEAPLRIECYDISNLQGEHVVASMVVFEDGLARKSEYRRFNIRGSGTGGAEQHDVAAMYEVIKRRFSRYLEESSRTGEVALMGESGDHGGHAAGGEPAPGKFAYPPNLVVVDGARPQAEAARWALDELGIEDIAVCGLAKRLEEVWLPDDEDPVILPRTGEGLYLLQRVRDEAHRFAITYHRQKRAKALTGSKLDELPGLGPARRSALIKEFGSVKRLASATAEEIAAVPGIGPKLAEAVHAHLSGGPAGTGREGDGAPEKQPTDEEADI
jgi:excinuclease ABC subunit C